MLSRGQEHLISLGHDQAAAPTSFIYCYSPDNQGYSYNTDGQTPLHVAASHSNTAMVELLCRHFPHVINKADNNGATALHLASRAHPEPSALSSTFATRISTKPAEDTSTIEVLLAQHANVRAQDKDGNTCLHFASAWGNLKAIRVLIEAGADPLCSNNAGWPAEYYSLTVQAEVYYRNLVAEWEKRRTDDEARRKEASARGPGVRLVTKDDEDFDESSIDDARDRADSGSSRKTTSTASGLGVSISRADTWG